MSTSTIRAALGGFLLILLATGCGTFGDVFGGDDDRTDIPSVGADVRGEVLRVDTVDREIEVDTSVYRTQLRSGADRMTVTYTDDTRVLYQGREYRPADLEPGDLIRVQLDDGMGRNVAERIEVEQSVQERGGAGGGTGGGTVSDTVRGEVERIDERARELAVDTGRETVWVAFDDRVPVYYQGREYRVANLEVGDEVEVRLDRDARGDLLARAITVTRSVQDGGGGSYEPPSDTRTFSGTVSWVDDRAGEFGLDLGRTGGVLRVTVPHSAGSVLRDRFERLRRGDRITVEAVPRGTDSAELVRFR